MSTNGCFLNKLLHLFAFDSEFLQEFHGFCQAVRLILLSVPSDFLMIIIVSVESLELSLFEIGLDTQGVRLKRHIRRSSLKRNPGQPQR